MTPVTTMIRPLAFYFAATEQEPQPWGLAGSDWANQMRQALGATPHPLYRLAAQPAEADLIVMCEPTQLSQQTWAPRLRVHPLVVSHPEKIYVASEEDTPLGFFPGIYCSLPKSHFDPRLHRTWIYRGTLNPHIASHQARAFEADPPLLAAFSGAASHPVRTALLARATRLAAAGIAVRETASCKFNANPADPALRPDQVSYIEHILGAKFALCPRGTGTGSFRLQEAMALGRAPVIISDEWVPVRGPDFAKCAIFVREADIARLPAILRAHAPRWREMGQAAQTAWRDYFDPANYCPRALDQLAAIARHRDAAHPAIGPARWQRLIKTEERRRKGPLISRIVRRLHRLTKS